MKLKIKLSLVAILFALSLSTQGQNGFLGSNHSYQINGNNLRIYLEAGFSKGSGICDFLDTTIINIQNDSIILDVLYDITGTHQTFFCTDYDTLDYNIPSGNYVLQIRNNIAFVNGNGQIDTALMTMQTFNNLVLSIDDFNSIDDIKLFPNPTHNQIYITGLAMNSSRKTDLSIYNTQGLLISRRDVVFTSESSITVNLNDLPSGIYLIQFQNNGKLFSKKIIKE